MLIVGEALNTSRLAQGVRHIEKAVTARDAEAIARIAVAQREQGAAYLDLNAGTLTSGEPEALAWMTTVTQEAAALPISFDSPNPAALRAALAVYDARYGPPLINSISAASGRYAAILPIARDFHARVIALAMDDDGIHQETAGRVRVATSLVERLLADGLPIDDIYVDPLVFPIATDDAVILTFLDIIPRIMDAFPGVHTIAGISNVSYGLPARAHLNRALALLAMGQGLDACIVDTQDRPLLALITAAEALLGRDESCRAYLAHARENAC
jgi:5-methyltetrahydrofolate--homocysteine methyltransferase